MEELHRDEDKVHATIQFHISVHLCLCLKKGSLLIHKFLCLLESFVRKHNLWQTGRGNRSTMDFNINSITEET